MWQKQLHNDSETQSETVIDESASTSAAEDKKPEPLETLVLDEEEEEGIKKEEDAVDSPVQVETIDLEEEIIPANELTEEPIAMEPSTISDDGNNTNKATTSSNSSSAPNNSRKNKKKKKSRSKSKF